VSDLLCCLLRTLPQSIEELVGRDQKLLARHASIIDAFYQGFDDRIWLALYRG
jgi:hypothetical protein